MSSVSIYDLGVRGTTVGVFSGPRWRVFGRCVLPGSLGPCRVGRCVDFAGPEVGRKRPGSGPEVSRTLAARPRMLAVGPRTIPSYLGGVEQAGQEAITVATLVEQLVGPAMLTTMHEQALHLLQAPQM